MNEIEILMRARHLISPPGSWTRQAAARDDKGLPCLGHEEQAVCWCLTGAIDKVIDASKGGHSLVRMDAIESLQAATGADRIWRWNDAPDRTHEEVLDALDRAIELALKGREPAVA